MKIVLIGLAIMIVLSGCTQPDGTGDTPAAAGVSNADVQELESIEREINSDLAEVDALLSEFDNTEFEELDVDPAELE